MGAILSRSQRIKPSILSLARRHNKPSFATVSTSQQSLDRQTYPILTLPAQYLRAMDASNYDAVTFQRTDISFDLDDGKPVLKSSSGTSNPANIIQDCSMKDDVYRIEWDDGLVSEYSTGWVEDQLISWEGQDDDRILWSGMTEQSLRASSSLTMDFSEALMDDGMRHALFALYQYGIVLVKNTPVDDNGGGVAALASALGGGTVKTPANSILSNYFMGQPCTSMPQGTDGPLRTLYGTVWSTTSSGQSQGASVADSAYGHEGLPLHTDMTYHRDPPGLQIFTMVHPAVEGGASLFGDGFAAAERLRTTNPQAFKTLSETIRRYRCVDEDTGWHLEGYGPVISVQNGRVVAIRHNDLDRLPDLPPPKASELETDEFYKRIQEAHAAWDNILAQDESRLVVSLEQGDTMVVANQVSPECCGYSLRHLSLYIPYISHIRCPSLCLPALLPR